MTTTPRWLKALQRPLGWIEIPNIAMIFVTLQGLGFLMVSYDPSWAYRLALIPEAQRPVVTHQSGAKQIDALRASYAAAGVQAELTPFIEDTATAFAQADLVIARAGASTVTEIAAVGAAALFVPFPFAVDDHQTTNARFLVEAGGAWLVTQSDLTAQMLAERLAGLHRETLLACAERAYAQRKTNATREVVMACEELAA